MEYLTINQQKMIILLDKNTVITKKNQKIWQSTHFYTQITKLIRAELVKTKWENKKLSYSLTNKGKEFVKFLKDLKEEWYE